MDRPPYAFSEAHRLRIEEIAARRAPRPIAEPMTGALVAGFFAGIVGVVVLLFGGDPDMPDHRREAVATAVSFLAGGIAYLFLRSQERAFHAAVDREARELWMGEEGSAYRESGGR